MSWSNIIEILKGKNGLEFGGTTELFSLPKHRMLLYPHVKLDGANKFDNNHFNGLLNENYNTGYGIGKRYNCDASNELQISQIGKKFDFIVTSHVIEHIANPIKAIKLWENKLLNEDGYILSIIPFYKECFDRNRPLTTINHLIEDYKNNVGEDDKTHIEEQKKLHDWSYGGHKEFYSLCENNELTRVVHHHTFNKNNIKDLFLYLNMDILYLFNHDPLNIVCLTKKING